VALSENWATLWEAIAARQPDHVAVVLGDVEMRWRDLDARAARLAAALSAHGIGAGDKVAQLMYNCPEYLESTFAAFKVRASTVNVNYRYRPPEVLDRPGEKPWTTFRVRIQMRGVATGGTPDVVVAAPA